MKPIAKYAALFAIVLAALPPGEASTLIQAEDFISQIGSVQIQDGSDPDDGRQAHRIHQGLPKRQSSRERHRFSENANYSEPQPKGSAISRSTETPVLRAQHYDQAFITSPPAPPALATGRPRSARAKRRLVPFLSQRPVKVARLTHETTDR